MITLEMLYQLRKEFMWRMMVDDWLMSLTTLNPKRTRIAAHTQFTRMLGDTGQILWDAFATRIPGYSTRLFTIDQEVDRARREAKLPIYLDCLEGTNSVPKL